MEPKTWSRSEIVALMLSSFREVRSQCAELGQVYKIEDAVEQIFDDLDERGLIERTP